MTIATVALEGLGLLKPRLLSSRSRPSSRPPRRRCCSRFTRGIGRFAAVLAVTALVTCALLYAATSWLGTREAAAAGSSPSRTAPLVVTGATAEARVRSALAPIGKLHPGVDLAIESASSSGIMVKVWCLSVGIGSWLRESRGSCLFVVLIGAEARHRRVRASEAADNFEHYSASQFDAANQSAYFHIFTGSRER